ncbi:P-loop containing nucleoside triphosphate hydrolase protein [Linnemannia elongata]|nr:P-loop containing nucleoside triphosphate hydrolase protein [Linnemannia elongata]
MSFFSPTAIEFNINLNFSASRYTTGKRVINVVFVGPTGAGKSRLINFLLGSNLAQTSMLTTSQTKDIHFYTTTVTSQEDGIDRWVYNLIDTQGLCDTAMSNEDVRKVIKKSIRQQLTHLNRIVIVLPHGRIDPLRREALETLITMFDLTRKTRSDKALVVITKCDGVKQSVLEEMYNDMKKDRTLSKIHFLTFATKISTGESICLDNICCVGLPDLESLDEDLAVVYRPKMDRSWKFIWSTLLYHNEGFVPIPTGLQKACLMQ